MQKILAILFIILLSSPAFALEINSSHKVVEDKVDVIDGLHDVPSADSSANSTIRDVIGNKTDTHDGNSIYSKLEEAEEHIHSVAKCYPTLANGITVTGGVGAWALGNAATIVPASTITSDYDIHWVNLGTISAADTYELVLYACDTDTEAGRLRFTRAAGVPSSSDVMFQSMLVPANCRITAKMASSSGGNDTAVVSIHYHTY